jgi:hypothetical protein
MRRGLPMVAPFDLVTNLLIVFVALVLVSVPKQKISQIKTLGLYAVTIKWPDGSKDDVDLYVKDPSGNIVYFVNRDAGFMHLEHDDLGEPDEENYERVILRGIEPGEYIVNVHMYGRYEPGDIVVVVELWRLQGNDKRLYSRRIVLQAPGQEETAFRFVPGRDKYSHLSQKFIE